MDSGLEGSSSDIMAAHELENSWCILNHDESSDELCEQINPKMSPDEDNTSLRSLSSASSDIEIIAETQSESESHTQANSPPHSLSPSPSYATLETSELLLNPEEEIDLNPGIKVYLKPYTPNAKVNSLLNISLLVALAAVTGLGIGNYMTNRAVITREKERILRSRLETCFPMNRTRAPVSVPATTRSLIATSQAITAISTPMPAISRPGQQMQIFVPVEPVKHPNHYINIDEISSPTIVKTIEMQFCRELNKNLVIETISSFDLMDKYSRKMLKKQKSGKIFPKKLYVWLLITDKGTSRPVFFLDNPRKDELNIISKLFVSAHFGKEKSVLWLNGCPYCLSFPHQISSHSQLEIVPSSDNFWYNRQEKLMKHFWSKVKHSLYSSSKIDNGKDLKEKIYDAILSITEDEYISMFAKLRSKIRKSQAKDSFCGDSL